MNSKYLPERISRLIYVCLFGTATEEEEKELLLWLEEKESNRTFYRQLLEEHYRLQALKKFMQYDSRQDWRKVSKSLKKPLWGWRRRLLPYAAMLLVALGIGGTFSYLHFRQVPEVTVTREIIPGHYQARLVLPHGKMVALTGKPEEDSLLQSMIGGRVVDNGRRLTYDPQQYPDEVSTHILQVPRGGEYQVVLADGTRIWLNADSELRYPDHFNGDVRRVMLSGEAYFEVAKDSQRPFLVQTEGMEVKVLGTSFNVSAYRGENLHTTLIEGSVSVATDEKQVVIVPGEQALLQNGILQTKKVKTANYIAWKTQRFVYEEKLLKEIFRDLERWYDVSFVCTDPKLGDLHLTTNLPKYVRIDQVLEIIAYAACVKFDVEGRIIKVYEDK